VLAVGSALALSVMSAILKHAMREGAALAHAVFIRSLVTALFAGGAVAAMRISLRRLPWRVLLSRSALGGSAMCLAFYAISRLPLGDAEVLNRSSPVFVLLFSWPLLVERPTRAQVVLVAAAFAGAALVVRPTFAVSAVPATAAVLAAALAAGAYMCVRRLAREIPVTAVVLVFTGTVALASLPFALAHEAPPSRLLLLLLLAGGSGTFGQVLMTHAYRFAKAGVVATYGYTGVVFSTLLGLVQFGEVPLPLTIAGMALIAGSCVLLVRTAEGWRREWPPVSSADGAPGRLVGGPRGRT
jgi:drug/metabolite transporter (DMT)-like permease